MKILLALQLLMVLSSCDSLFDDRPDYYVEGLRTNLYLSVPLSVPDGEPVTATVLFRTRKPLMAPIVPAPAVRVVSFSREGDNIYDGTLGDGVIESTYSNEELWDWAGTVPFPQPAFPGGDVGARRVGLEVTSGLVFEAFRAAAIAGEACDVDVLGAGVRSCSPWIDAVLQLDVRCRGAVQEFVDCSGLQYVILPAIAVGGIARPTNTDRTMTASAAEPTILFTPELYLYLAPDGWRYKQLSPHDFYQPTFPDISERLSYGPFAEPEEAARHAAVHLELTASPLYAALAASCDAASGVGRAAATLQELLHAPRVPKLPLGPPRKEP